MTVAQDKIPRSAESSLRLKSLRLPVSLSCQRPRPGPLQPLALAIGGCGTSHD